MHVYMFMYIYIYIYIIYIYVYVCARVYTESTVNLSQRVYECVLFMCVRVCERRHRIDIAFDTC